MTQLYSTQTTGRYSFLHIGFLRPLGSNGVVPDSEKWSQTIRICPKLSTKGVSGRKTKRNVFNIAQREKSYIKQASKLVKGYKSYYSSESFEIIL